MDWEEFGGNSSWCLECQQHKSDCTCDPKTNIYLVEYRMDIKGTLRTDLQHWCQERVRCVAYDDCLARSKVTQWALETEYIWWTENDETTQHRVPIGDRDVTIVSVSEYAADVGEMLKQCPLPEIFPHTD